MASDRTKPTPIEDADAYLDLIARRVERGERGNENVPRLLIRRLADYARSLERANEKLAARVRDLELKAAGEVVS